MTKLIHALLLCQKSKNWHVACRNISCRQHISRCAFLSFVFNSSHTLLDWLFVRFQILFYIRLSANLCKCEERKNKILTFFKRFVWRLRRNQIYSLVSCTVLYCWKDVYQSNIHLKAVSTPWKRMSHIPFPLHYLEPSNNDMLKLSASANTGSRQLILSTAAVLNNRQTLVKCVWACVFVLCLCACICKCRCACVHVSLHVRVHASFLIHVYPSCVSMWAWHLAVV